MNSHERTHMLIDAVSKRPALYDKDNPMYTCHNKFKQRLWKETCAEVYPDWENLSMHKRIEYGRELQKRWKNLRTCFAREMALQKKEHEEFMNGKELKRRKRYEHFNRMLFLLNTEQKKRMEEIMTITHITHTNDDGEDHSEVNNDTHDNVKAEYFNEFNDDYDDDNNIHMVIEPEDPQKCLEDPFQSIKHTVQGDDIKDNCNEDKLFLLSLLKTFQKFDDRQRFEAKIQILKTLKKIQFPDD